MANKITLLTAALLLVQLFHVIAQASPTTLWQEDFNTDGSSQWPVINHGDTATICKTQSWLLPIGKATSFVCYL